MQLRSLCLNRSPTLDYRRLGRRLAPDGGAAPGRFDFGSFATTSSYEVFTSDSISRRSSASPSSCSCTHMFRAMYGAGMMPGRSTSSPNDSGVHLKAIECGGSMLTTANIFPATQKQRSLPHLMSSVTAGGAPHGESTVSLGVPNSRP